MIIAPAFLARIKDHLRVTGATEDDLITGYAQAACEYVQTFVDDAWDWTHAVVPAGSESGIPASFVAAVLLLVGDLYEHREAQTEVDLSANKTVERLLWPYRYRSEW